MRFRGLSTALAGSMIVGASTMIGCDSETPVDPKAAAATQAALEQQNKTLAESVKNNPRVKGAVPKSIKGGLHINPPAGGKE